MLTAGPGARQRVVSAAEQGSSMPDPTLALLHRLIGGDPSAASQVIRTSETSSSPPLLVAAALLGRHGEILDRAEALSTTSRDRQLVALARAHLGGDTDRLDALVRDHLSDYPDNLLASWIAGRPAPSEVPPTSITSPEDTTS
jgi:hypothetical protein